MDFANISADFIKSLGFEIKYQHFRVFNDLNTLNPSKPYGLFVANKKLRECVKKNQMPDNTIYNEIVKMRIGVPHVKTLCPQRGGYTRCILIHKSGYKFTGDGFCSDNDVFCKKTGRTKALENALKSAIEFLMESQYDK